MITAQDKKKVGDAVRHEKVTIDEAASKIGKSYRAVRDQIKKAGIVPDKAGRYPLPDVLAANKEAEQRDNRNGNFDSGKGKNIKLMLQSQLLKLELDEKRGTLIEKGIVYAEVSELWSILKQDLMMLPSSCAPLCVGKSVKEIKGILSLRRDDLLRKFENKLNDRNS